MLFFSRSFALAKRSHPDTQLYKDFVWDILHIDLVEAGLQSGLGIVGDNAANTVQVSCARAKDTQQTKIMVLPREACLTPQLDCLTP